MIQFYCKYMHIQYASVYEENHSFLALLIMHRVSYEALPLTQQGWGHFRRDGKMLIKN